MSEKSWNPRYLAYCAATGGLGPQATLERDIKLWPGGRMAGFMLWIREQWTAWHAVTGYRGFVGDEQHHAFDAWLEMKS